MYSVRLIPTLLRILAGLTILSASAGARAASDCSYRFKTFADIKQEDQLTLTRVLDMNPGQFATSSRAATFLFSAATEVSNEMTNLGSRITTALDRGGAAPARYGVKLKRDDPTEFWKTVVQKMYRKNYASVRDVSDLARGRIDVGGANDVRRAVQMLQQYASGRGYTVHIEPPRRPIPGKTGLFGYPRYHVILTSGKGIQFEWQVGTGATTRVWEKTGIPIPAGLQLPPGTVTDIHDIEYRIFQPIWKNALGRNPDPGLAALERELRLKAFTDEVDVLAGESALQGDKLPRLDQRVDALHRKAGRILQGIVDRKGTAFVERLLRADNAE